MNHVIIFAAGIGDRMNTPTIPKQFLKVDGIEILIHTILNFEKHEEIDTITVVTVKSYIDEVKRILDLYNIKKVHDVVQGGDSAIESQYLGLKSLSRHAKSKDIVLLHDGVRPLLDEKTISINIECASKNITAITVAPAIETIVIVDEDERMKSTVERSSCRLARAPQSYQFNKIFENFEEAKRNNLSRFVDSASLMESYGYSLYTVDGPAENIKITTQSDFFMFEAFYFAKKEGRSIENE